MEIIKTVEGLDGVIVVGFFSQGTPLFIYLFIYGRVGSSFLCKGFL